MTPYLDGSGNSEESGDFGDSGESDVSGDPMVLLYLMILMNLFVLANLVILGSWSAQQQKIHSIAKIDHCPGLAVPLTNSSSVGLVVAQS